MSTQQTSGLVTNIQRSSLNDGAGIRSLVFLKGCPLRCAWCANPETQEKSPVLVLHEERCIGCGACQDACPDHSYGGRGGSRCTLCLRCEDSCPSAAIECIGKRMTVEQVMEEVTKDRIYYRHSGGGITISGGEPLFQPDFTRALLKAARESGMSTAIETCGYAEEIRLLDTLSLCDEILFDVKLIDTERHRQYTGVHNEKILKNIAEAARSYADRMVLRMPLIETVNCTETDVQSVCELAMELGIGEIHLLPYHEFGIGKYALLGRSYSFAGKRPDGAALERMAHLVRAHGLKCIVGG